jgi:hypothetical protein
MNFVTSAPVGACGTSCCDHQDDTVHWLTPRGNRSRAGLKLRRAAMKRLTTTVGAGVVLAATSAGTAFGPANAHTSTAPAVSEPVLAPVQTVRAAPIAIATSGTAGDEASNAAPAPSVPFGLDILQADLKRFMDDHALGRDAGRDPEEVVRFGAMRVKRGLVETILRAAEDTGVDPAYMMALADKESSFSTESRAKTSSAQGLFQFVSQTWFEVIRTFGPRHGLKAEAAAIERIGGLLTVADAEERERILHLRCNPYIAAVMAAEMMKRDRSRIEKDLGRDLTRSEFYLAHFLGPDSAGRLMRLLGEKPKQSAPRVFPQAAKANKAIFYAKDGRKTRHLTVAEVYSRLDRMIDQRIDRYQGVSALATIARAF